MKTEFSVVKGSRLFANLAARLERKSFFLILQGFRILEGLEKDWEWKAEMSAIKNIKYLSQYRNCNL